MYLHSVTIYQRPAYFDLAEYFYDQVLGLPHRVSLGERHLRWFDRPAHLAISTVPYGEDPAWAGRFSGVHFNVYPSDVVDTYLDALKQTGLKMPDPREVDGVRVLTVHDSSDNTMMILGFDEQPDQPLIDEALGSASIFVEDIARARTFYTEVLGLAVRAQPHEGLVVLGETGTALMLYQVPKGNPNTPIGRHTGMTFAAAELAPVLARLGESDGEVLDEMATPESDGQEIAAATIADGDGNVLTLLSESHLRRVEAASQAPDDDEAPA